MGKRIFISFSSKDQEKANKIVDFLEKNNHKCFISSRDLVAGKEYAGQLIDNIMNAEAVVLLLSKGSNDSPHVLREVECAVSKRIPVIVYVLEEVTLSKSMNYYLMTHQWIPTGWNQDERLLEGLNNIENGTEVSHSEEKNSATPGKKKTKITAIIVTACLLVAACVVIATIGFLKKTDAGFGLFNKAEAIKEINPGQEVVFGTYLGSPIEWIVLKSDDDTYTLVSKNILSMKCFDAAEGGCYGEYDGVSYFSYDNHIITDQDLVVKVRGNNDWSKSNLRTWLNSDKGIVAYEDQSPCVDAVYSNPYDSKAGFLKEFSEDEKNAMTSVTVKTKVNELNADSTDGMIETTDYVYLLSSEELKYFEDIDMHIYASPTEEAALEDDGDGIYRLFSEDYKTTNYNYWLRDNNPEEDANMAYFAVTEIDTGIKFDSASVGACAYGVRPVITVKKASVSENMSTV